MVYERSTAFAPEGWSYADSVRFEYNIVDTTRAYELVLDVHHSADFPYQNFYVLLHTGLPSGKRVSEQLSLQLAGDFGAWLGDCSGNDCTLSIPLLGNARFGDPGTYTLTVEQHSRDEPLQGVNGLGLRVVVRER